MGKGASADELIFLAHTKRCFDAKSKLSFKNVGTNNEEMKPVTTLKDASKKPVHSVGPSVCLLVTNFSQKVIQLAEIPLPNITRLMCLRIRPYSF